MRMSEAEQVKIFRKLKAVLVKCISSAKAQKGALIISTPFMDWKGNLVTIYVTEDLKITDGGDTINQMRALRVIEDFEKWAFKEDFLGRYNLCIKGNEIVPKDTSPGALLWYLQGISRLPGYFKPNPIGRAEPTPKDVKRDEEVNSDKASEERREITIRLDEEVYKRIRSELGFKKLCGNTHGVLDEFLAMTVHSIEKGEKTLSLELNETNSKRESTDSKTKKEGVSK